MRPPRKIKVNEVTYDVEFDAGRLVEQDAHALTLPRSQKIVLNNHSGPDIERRDMIHELLHTMLEVSGLDLSEKREEKVVVALAGPLLSLIRNNPALITYLTS